MNLEILMSILVISGIAVGASILLNRGCKGNDDLYDERQLIERGRGANLAMSTALVYLMMIVFGYAFDLIRPEDTAIFAMYGLTVTSMVFDGYCIFRDAYLNREQELSSEVWRTGLLGAVWLAMAIPPGSRWGTMDAWIDGALALGYLSQSAMLLLWVLVLRIQDRRAEKE